MAETEAKDVGTGSSIAKRQADYPLYGFFIPVLLLSTRGKRLSMPETQNLSALSAPSPGNCQETGYDDGGRKTGDGVLSLYLSAPHSSQHSSQNYLRHMQGVQEQHFPTAAWLHPKPL